MLVDHFIPDEKRVLSTMMSVNEGNERVNIQTISTHTALQQQNTGLFGLAGTTSGDGRKKKRPMCKIEKTYRIKNHLLFQ